MTRTESTAAATARHLAAARDGLPDADSRRWVADLRAVGPRRDDAIARLHELLLRAARFEAGRRRPLLPHLAHADLDDLVNQAADDALVAVLRRLDDYRGASRFTTWVYKFALLETAVKLRRRAWQAREVALDPEQWSVLPHRGSGPEEEAEQGEFLTLLADAVESVLTPHQRTVFVALALNEVPIDVLAESLGTTRNALYKTLHDARKKLRAHLDDEWVET